MHPAPWAPGTQVVHRQTFRQTPTSTKKLIIVRLNCQLSAQRRRCCDVWVGGCFLIRIGGHYPGNVFCTDLDHSSSCAASDWGWKPHILCLVVSWKTHGFAHAPLIVIRLFLPESYRGVPYRGVHPVTQKLSSTCAECRNSCVQGNRHGEVGRGLMKRWAAWQSIATLCVPWTWGRLKANQELWYQSTEQKD